MDEARLSQRERRILAEIEESLSEDESLERGLRTMRREGGSARGRDGVRHGLRGHLPALGVALLGVLTLGLLALAVATGEPALIWAFAAVWVLTLCGLLRLVMRWSRRVKPQSWPK
ncbi:hypothetical protein [Streptomyces vilmorinianum]|uniref:hypothetical protein n=1 Tax=Streptomyces vilmorinianum TaxID=3051092 RepID=UPI0010FB7A51|nr:hypothetical protein [Streptomyces vilmorinianum]